MGAGELDAVVCRYGSTPRLPIYATQSQTKQTLGFGVWGLGFGFFVTVAKPKQNSHVKSFQNSEPSVSEQKSFLEVSGLCWVNPEP